MSATPRPWARGGLFGLSVYADGFGPVCEVHSSRPEDDSRAVDDACLIVRAVNNHDALVAALVTSRDCFEEGMFNIISSSRARAMVEMIEEALAAAAEKEQ